MSNSDETHILNLIRNLLLEEKERERVSSLRATHSDQLSLSEANLIANQSQSLPTIGSLSELMASSVGQQTQSTHTPSTASTAAAEPTFRAHPSLFGHHFESQAHHSIDELLSLSSGNSRVANTIPPLVPPPLPHSGLVSGHHQSRQSSGEDSSEAANQLLYASLVSSAGAHQSLSTSSLPFLLDSLSSSSTVSPPSVPLLARFESQIRSIANDIQQTIQLHMNGLQMRKEQLLKQLEHIKQTYSTVLTIASHQSDGDQSQTLPLPQITFTRPDSALYKAVTTLGFLTTPALAVNCSATGDGVETAMEGEASCFTITTRNCFNEELLIGESQILSAREQHIIVR